MNIRPAKLEDKQKVLEIIRVLHLDMPGFVWSQEAFVADQIKNGEYFLVKDNDTVAGIMSLRHGKKKIYIETLAVAKEFRGRKFGTQLVTFAKQFAREKGFAILHAYSFQQYQAGQFYAKQGFRQLSETGYYNNHPYDCFEVALDTL